MRFSLAFGLIFAIVYPLGAASPVKVSLDARAQQPGELVLVTVETDQPSSVTGVAFEADIPFFQSAGPTVWQALIGLDVDLEPGEYPLDLKVVSQAGIETCEKRMIRIAGRVFPTRHLTLPEEYVNPPAVVMERIRRETEDVKAIFATPSLERLWEGVFTRPVPGVVISSFGKRSVLNGQPRSIHGGVDLRAPMRTPLKAPAGGRVVLAKDLYFAGKSIILDHGLGLYSQFAHLSSFKVKQGDMVESGEVIGLTGRSGRVQGPHLHWSVRLGGSRIDPMALLELLGPGSKHARRPPATD